MEDNKKKVFVGVLVALVVGVGLLAVLRGTAGPAGPGEYDEFAQCLADEGATFYGAFWCPHCQAQKKLFGSSAKLLPYVECSTADGQGQTAICKEKVIPSYPTWEFADGSRLGGEVPLEQLAEKTGCMLPTDGATPEAPVNPGASSTVPEGSGIDAGAAE